MKKVRILLVAVALMCAAFTLAGCNEPIEDSGSGDNSKSYSSESAGPMNCVIIYSDHANSQASLSGVDAYVRGTKEACGYLGFVRLDGDPSVVYNEQTSNEHNNESNIKRENNEFVSERMTGLEGIKASSKEVDIIDSLKLANDCLEQSKDDGLDNVVVIVGTGLSTTGVVDFASTGLVSVDLSNYESWVNKSGQMPKLDHVDKIVWIGFDSVKSPQPEFPTESLVEQLEGFYTNIFKAAGVSSVEFKSTISVAESSASDLPSVSVVEMPAKAKYGAGDVAEVSADVLFNPDESTFLNGMDPSKNEQVIEIANSIKTNNLHVTVTGYTAHYGTQSHGGVDGLSYDRAVAIRDVLVEMGCPAESITVVGGGWGPYDDDQKNRCVQFKFE